MKPLLYLFIKRRSVIVKGKVITMFDLYTKVVKNNIGVYNVLVKVSYNTTELSKYTDVDGLAVFEDIPSNIAKLDVLVDISEAWIREAKITEDWENFITAQLHITEDWEQLFSRELRITEDWEEIFSRELKLTEDWEIYFVNELKITEDWES